MKSALWCIVLLLAACDSPSGPVSGPPAKFAILSGNNQQATVGGALAPFVIKVTDSAGLPVAGVRVHWTVFRFNQPADTFTAATTADGESSAVATASLTATRAYYAAVARLDSLPPVILFQVATRPGPVVQGKLDRDTATTFPGGAVPLNALYKDAYGNAVDSVASAWSSSDTTIATVDNLGRVRGVRPGTATITARAGAAVVSARVTVAAPLPVSVTLSALEPAPIAPGDFLQLVAKDQFGNAVTPSDWRSLNPTVATVDASGLVRGVMPGDATITAAENENTAASITVHVYRTGRLTDLKASFGRTCGLDARAQLYCWGYSGERTAPIDGIAQAPDACTAGNRKSFNIVACHTKPTPVALNASVLAYDIASTYGCAIVASGALFCWGRHPAGAVQSQTIVLPEPVTVGGAAFTSIATNDALACALTSNAVVYCWTGSPTAIAVNIPGGVRSLGTNTFSLVNFQHANRMCAIDARGAVYCWTTSSVSTDARGALVIVPEQIPGLGNPVFTSVTPNRDAVCALTTSGEAYCTGQPASPNVLVPIDPAHSYRELLSNAQPCGITTAGQLYCPSVFGNVQLDGLAAFAVGLQSLTQNSQSLHYCFTQVAGPSQCTSDNGLGQLGIGYNQQLFPSGRTKAINADVITP